MQALVTGATGFIGRPLVHALSAAGHCVRAMVRDPRKVDLLPDAVEVQYADLTDGQAMARLVDGADVVFHLAAATAGGWERQRRLTVEGTRALLAAATAAGVKRFVHVSSVAVYDRAGLALDEEVTEACPLWAATASGGPYASAKVEAEALAWAAAERAAMEVVIARPGLVYGNGRVLFEHLGIRLGVATFLPLGGGSVRLPLVHVDNLVDALLRLMQAPAAAGRTFNVVDEEQPTKAQYLRALSKATGRRYRCVGLPAAPVVTVAHLLQRAASAAKAPHLAPISAAKVRARTNEHRYDCRALVEATGWRPRLDLARGLAIATQPPRLREPVEVRRVGLIGAGRMADFHIRALRSVPGVEVTGVLDTSADRAAELAKRYDLPLATTSAEEFYDRARPQCVHILTPPQSHAELALAAIRRGAHVFVEKPAAITPEECVEIQREARVRGVTVGIDHNFVTDPRVRRCRWMIDGAAIGDLVHLDVFWAFDIRRLPHLLASDAQANWVARLPGGPLEDLAPHPLSLALSLVNEQVATRSVHVFRSGRLSYEFDDELRLLLAGSCATISIAMSLSVEPDDVVVTAFGTEATVRLDVQNMLLLQARRGRGPKPVARGLRALSTGLGTVFQTVGNVGALALKRLDAPADPSVLIREHYAALAGGGPLPVDIEQGRRALEIVRAVWPVAEACAAQGVAAHLAKTAEAAEAADALMTAGTVETTRSAGTAKAATTTKPLGTAKTARTA